MNLREIEDGRLSRNVTIRDGDTIFVPKAERFFVIGMVRNPGSYVLERNMTVLQAISTAGGISERGSNRRLKIVRIVDNKRKELDAKPTDIVTARRHDRRAAAAAVSIVFLSPTGQTGGAEAALHELLAGLRESHPSWSLRLIVASDGPLVARVEALGVPVRGAAVSRHRWPGSAIGALGAAGGRGSGFWRVARQRRCPRSAICGGFAGCCGERAGRRSTPTD